jgi:hypothetical protein
LPILLVVDRIERCDEVKACAFCVVGQVARLEPHVVESGSAARTSNRKVRWPIDIIMATAPAFSTSPTWFANASVLLGSGAPELTVAAGIALPFA